jgi:hypothetical protein
LKFGSDTRSLGAKQLSEGCEVSLSCEL